jgi:hypothetical protein
MSAPCFLIVHPKGTLLWDTGLGDAIAAHPMASNWHRAYAPRCR